MKHLYYGRIERIARTEPVADLCSEDLAGEYPIYNLSEVPDTVSAGLFEFDPDDPNDDWATYIPIERITVNPA